MGPPLSRNAGEGAEPRGGEAGEGAAGMRYEGVRWRLDLPLPALTGAHQIVNAGTAIACLEQLAPAKVTPTAIAKGLGRIEWPARLQRLHQGPLVEMLPADWELWLDGGHNPSAGDILADMAKGWNDRPLYLIVGMLNTKDAGGFLAPLAAHARLLEAVTIPGEENPHPAAQLVADAKAVGIPAREAETVETALREVIGKAGPARVLICGSLHLAGAVLTENG